MRATPCAVCGTKSRSRVEYEANFDPAHITPALFSARRLPDRVHYRMVRCTQCGLLRSDPVFDDVALKSLYEASTVTYSSDYPGLIRTYGRYLDEASRYLSVKGSLLEIGCGDGFFLSEALRRGFSEVSGVEPSREAIAAAHERVRPFIVQGLYQRDQFPPVSFDCICMFQVIDHLPDPAAAAEALFLHLKPGGVALVISHDERAWTNRLLGARSPIIDIAHTYLFSEATISKLFVQGGMKKLFFKPCFNAHSLRHWAELFPAPQGIKSSLLKIFSKLGMSEILLTLPAGNFVFAAQKPL